MEESLIKSLQLLDLSPKEIKFFLAAYKNGSNSIVEIAKVARIERSTAYLIAEQLTQKGLLEDDLKHYGKKIIAVEPAKLIKLISAKQRQLRRQELELEEKLPELQSIYQVSEIRPKVKVYEGKKGLILIWQDIMTSSGELLLWSNQEKEGNIFTGQEHEKFIQQRLLRKIPIRVLVINNSSGLDLKKSDKKFLRQTKLLTKGVDFTAETYIYDNKIAILDYKKDVIGVLIESEPMAQSHKAMFEAMWSSLAD